MFEDASEAALRMIRMPESARADEVRRLRQIATDYPGQRGYIEEVLKTVTEYLGQLEAIRRPSPGAAPDTSDGGPRPNGRSPQDPHE